MNESVIKSCSFFGHRDTELTEELKNNLKETLKDLIENQNVLIFLFGSRSNFNSLCHLVITELKEIYTNIKRISYTCKGEACTFENERAKWEEIYSRVEKRKIQLLGVEEEYEHKSKYVSGRASYVERNQSMINNSNYCIFYYDENYCLPIRKYSRKSLGYYQPKSGTALAYAYAKQKKKVIINLLQL